MKDKTKAKYTQTLNRQATYPGDFSAIFYYEIEDEEGFPSSYDSVLDLVEYKLYCYIVPPFRYIIDKYG